MSRANAVVERILQSPAHRVLSGSMVLVRYRGRRSGTEYTLPVQYADTHQGLVVLVGEAEDKTWWRNFTEMGQAQVLHRGEWIPMTAHALQGAIDPEAVTPLLRSYAVRYPKVVKQLDGDTLDERVAHAVVVWLRAAA
jgi:deazaflavin-dependent oxidoreductase (nitroreductase family)